mgnify:CR=1 FL=1
MSTENNLQTLYENSVKILVDLIAFKTISGEDNNSLINYCDEILKKLGATSFKTFDNEKKRVNLFATLKAKIPSKKKPIILSGHTDVVPPGNISDWSVNPFKPAVKKNKLICALSGGVDSTVVALLLKKAIGNQLTCIFINTGLLRKNEEREVLRIFRKQLKFKLIYVNASKLFLKKLNNVTNPESKRKIIGRLFIELFEKYAKKIKKVNPIK